MSRVVVGVDGSDGSRRALEWAYAEAEKRGASLEVVAAWGVPPIPPLPETASWPPPTAKLEAAAQGMVDLLLGEIVGSRTGVSIETTLVEGSPARVLLARGKGADMLVVGSRGLGGFRSLLLGSVSQQCAQHATCPIVIVPPAERDSGLSNDGPRLATHDRVVS